MPSHNNRTTRQEKLEQKLPLSGDVVLVAELDTSPASFQEGIAFNGATIFVADDGSGDVELWKTDGTRTGTVRVRDIRAGGSSFPEWLTKADSLVYFTAYDDEFGRELWATDGTEPGTVRLTDLDTDLPNTHGQSRFPLIHTVGNRAYFRHDGELWTTEGSPASTQVVEGLEDGSIGSMTVSSNAIFFTLNDQVWSTNGTNAEAIYVLPDHDSQNIFAVGESIFYIGHNWGIDQPMELIRYSESAEPVTLISEASGTLGGFPWGFALDNRLVFGAVRGRHPDRVATIWSSDGTVEGTLNVREFSQEQHIQNQLVFDERLFFQITQNGNIWVTDGTEAGTVEVLSSVQSHPNPLVPTANSLFAVDNGALLRLNGNSFETVSLADSMAEQVAIISNGAHDLAWVDQPNRLLTLADGEVSVVSTSLFGRSVEPSTSPQSPKLHGVGDGVVLAADSGLWFSDGSLGNLQHLTDFDDDFSSFDFSIVSVADYAYFTATDDNGTRRLWLTDGSQEGTRAIVFDAESVEIEYLLASDTSVFFTGFTDDAFFIWTMSSEEEPVSLVNLDEVGDGGVWPIEMAAFDDSVYYINEFAEENTEVWRTNGQDTTLIGTLPSFDDIYQLSIHASEESVFVKTETELYRLDLSDSENTFELIDDLSAHSSVQGFVGRRLLYNSLENGARQLKVSDGTVEGTQTIAEFGPGVPAYYPVVIDSSDTIAYFVVDGGLWKTDGTADGTKLVSDAVSPFLDHGFTFGKITKSGDFFFSGCTTETSCELWRSDGTNEGTVQVADIAPGAERSEPKYFTESNGKLFFTANDGFHGHELHRVDLQVNDRKAGDADGDGLIGFSDFLILSSNFGTEDSVTFADGDFDEDNDVDFQDFLLLSENFGTQ